MIVGNELQQLSAASVGARTLSLLTNTIFQCQRRRDTQRAHLEHTHRLAHPGDVSTSDLPRNPRFQAITLVERPGEWMQLTN